MEEKIYKYEKTCVFCDKQFKTNNEGYKWCYNCFTLFYRYGGIKSYAEFLDAFGLSDCVASKDSYIKFVDNLRQVKEVRGDWKTDRILENPGDFLDKIKEKEIKRKDH